VAECIDTSVEKEVYGLTALGDDYCSTLYRIV
jgi:hypothetical protein